LSIDIDKLKRTTIIIEKALENALRIRSNAIAKYTNADPEEVSVYLDDPQFQLSMAFNGGTSLNMHKLNAAILDNYNWDLRKLFEVASDPQLLLWNGIPIDQYDGDYAPNEEWNYKFFILKVSEEAKRAGIKQGLERMKYTLKQYGQGLKIKPLSIKKMNIKPLRQNTLKLQEIIQTAYDVRSRVLRGGYFRDYDELIGKNPQIHVGRTYNHGIGTDMHKFTRAILKNYDWDLRKLFNAARYVSHHIYDDKLFRDHKDYSVFDGSFLHNKAIQAYESWISYESQKHYEWGLNQLSLIL